MRYKRFGDKSNRVKKNSLFAKLTSALLAFLFFIAPLAPALAAEDGSALSSNSASDVNLSADTNIAADALPPAELINDNLNGGKNASTDSTVDLAAPAVDDLKTKDKAVDKTGVELMTASSVSDSTSENLTKTQDKTQFPQSEILTGALTYEYPISVPLGRNDLQPGLKLSYNSQVGEEGSIVGYGWNINIPYIERINRKGTDKLYIENYFNSSLSGELVNISGTSYSAKVDNSEFLKYEFDNNSWTATDKQGTKYKFGYSVNTRQDDLIDSTKVFKWMLEEIRDTNDNFIRYEYFKDAGQIYPSKIFYTGSGSTDGIFEVEFLRATRTDAATSYKTGFSAKTAYWINEIQTKVNSLWIKKYTLVYTIGDNSNRSLLNSIIETGKDESSSIEVSLPATTFNYQGNASGSWTLNPSLTLPLSFHSPNNSEPKGTRAADINGDGLVDIVRLIDMSGDDIRLIYINNGHGWDKNTAWVVPINFGFTNQGGYGLGAEIADVNGDGLADLLERSSDYHTNNVYLNTGSGWVQDTTWSVPTDFGSGTTDLGTRLVDVNGDGLIDIIRGLSFTHGMYSNGYYNREVYINNGHGWTLDSSFFLSLSFASPNNSEPKGTRAADINGDGLVDIVRLIDMSGDDIRLIYLNNGHGWTISTSWVVPANFGFIDQWGYSLGTEIIDVNGDGLADLVESSPSNNTNKVYFNTGSGWVQDASWSLPTQLSSPTEDLGTRFGDVNGDGLIDIIRGLSFTHGLYSDGYYNREVYINNAKKADLLIFITYPQGGSTDIAYKATPLYTNGSSLLNSNLPFVLDTVQQITNSDGAGLNFTMSYSYEGGKYYFANAYDRKFSGFAKVIRIDVVGNLTNTYFHQGDITNSGQGEFSDHISKIGKIYRTETFDSAGNLFSKTISKWENYDLGNGRNFVKLTQKIDSNYDGSTSLTTGGRDKAETYAYDNTNGNLTEKIQWGEVTGTDDGTFIDIGTDKLAASISYASNLITNIIGLPSQETILDQSSNKVKESKYYYDTLALGGADKGNQTKEEKWKSGTDYINTQKSYNSYGLVIQETDPRGKITNYTYDSYNLYPAAITNALNQSTQYIYDYSAGKPKQIIDTNGFVFQTVFDGFGRVLEEKQPDLAAPSILVTKSAYIYTDIAGAVSVKKTDYLDATTSIDSYSYFDGLGRIIQTRQEAEDTNNFSVKDFVYNNRGLLNKESLPYFSFGYAKTVPSAVEGLYSVYSYDPLQRITSTVNAAGTVSNFYDDWKVTTIDAKGVAKDLYKDAYGNLVQVDEHSSTTFTTSYTYDGAGNLIKITDALGNIRNFTYDNLGHRLTAEDLHSASDTTFGTWTYTYDAAGNLISQLDPKNQTVNYTYDDINRRLIEDYTGQAGTEKTYTYDACVNGIGRLCAVTLSSVEGSSSESKEYNALGAVSKETKTINSVNYTTQYDFDRQGNNILLTNPDNSQVKNIYNSAGQLEQIQRKESIDVGFSDVVTDFDYSPLGKITYQADANGVITTNTYDAAKLYRLISKITTIAGGINAQDLTYTYDANGNITKIIDASATNSAKTVDYTYDSLNRLLTATATGAANSSTSLTTGSQNYSETYVYDAIGNIISKNGVVYTYSQIGNANPHAVTSIGSANYNYDDNGNLLSDGNLANTWDYQNRLIQTTISSISTSAPVAATATFAPVKGDGSIYKTNSSWTTAHNATSGTSTNYTGTATNVRTGKNGTTSYLIERAFIPFNTAALPDNAAITGVKLKVYVSSKLNNDNDGDDWVTVARATEASTTSLVSSDYDNVGGVTNPIEGIDTAERKDITSVATGQYLTFNLNNTGKNWISLTGSTKLALREGHDAKNSAFVGTSGKYNQLTVRTGEYTGTANDPILEVAYTLPPTVTTTTTTISYGYDASGQRIKYSNGTKTTIYPSKYYNTDSTTPTKHIFAGDQLVGTISGSDASAVAHTVSTDHLTGSNVVTNSAGTLEELMDYYPYGAIRLNEKAGSFDEQRKYAGSEFDTDTGLNYMNARYYSSGVGRFVSQDPVFISASFDLTDPQGFNSYAYARNNPLRYIDPTGMSIESYTKDSFEQTIYGNYTSKVNAGGTALQIGTGLIGIDLLGDIRDLSYDVKNWQWTWGHAGKTVLDGIGLFPVVGVLKYADEAGALVKGERAITKVDPSTIRYTQDSISSTFRNGNTLESTVDGLKSGKISPDNFPPIRIFEKDGNIFSLDNRRLNVFKEAGVDIPARRATQQELKNELVRKFTTPNEGKSIIKK